MGCRGLGEPLQPLAPINRIERSGLQIRRIIDALQCDSATVCGPTDPASVTVWASRIGLADPYPPAFSSAPSGPLVAGGGAVEGERSVMFRAEDRGGGIASVAFVVDGAKLEEQAADRTAKSCARPYTSTVPCPLAVEKIVTFDTNQIANGPHEIAVAITDAGGNRTVSAPVNVKVHNPGAANGAHASRFARLDAWFETRSTRHRDSATLPYARTRAIVGTLVDEAGAPINDAVLDVSAVAARPGASTRSLGQVATDVAGRFRYLPRAGSSRKLTIGYRAFHLDTAPSATATLNLSVRAGVALNVRPRRVSSRGRIAFSGRLRGGPGRAGTQVVIYALGGARSRIPVATVRANAKGQFHYRYRFRNSAPGVTYRFRAVMHSQASYPYATGNSRDVTVRIR